MSETINSTFMSESFEKLKKLVKVEKPKFSPEDEASHTIWEMNNLKRLNPNRSSAFLATKAAELAQKRDSIFEQYPDVKTSLLKKEELINLEKKNENADKLLNKDIPNISFKFDEN